ncbi:efflux RND transporter periplasmic adaptor subunit [Vitreoscilla massiliensis]|uniref:Efflux RND transporter periplasmic adaptor subunit n=1 Tax=Vitreoscilla massiliensis TaxID=1689272 RepID=A0ABY4E082_9NEIS|nr:efflux RND transporter periplasmic adaptor subunit [Vitreoscilla massiliensis]UOO88790.1 efflux RND transporter periplasmic adaptor subunit [Vitreoscilla massiliensis]
MNKKIKWLLLAIGVVALALAAYFFWFNKQEKVDYITETVSRGDLAVTVNATGTVSAAQKVTVGAQASGQIKKLYIKVGDQVKKGDLIAQIDPITQQNTLQTKQAELASLNAQVANQKIQLDIASKQYQREQALLSEDASSREAVENAKDAWSAAQAALKQTQASIKQTTVAINTAEVELGYTKIIAPFTGTVVSVPVEEGQTVNANQTTPTIAEIADLSQMEVKLEIAEGDITKVKAGLPVEYTILSEPNEKFHTTLQSIDPGLTTLTDGTYTESSSSDAAVYYYAKLLVPNEEGKLRIGMTTQNVITSQEVKNTLIVPTMAIKKQKGKRVVQVLQADGKVEERDIKVGLTDGLNTQVLSGLKEGDKVIMGSMSASEKSQAVQQGQGRRPSGGMGPR